ncbi:hypothetical protein BZG02_15510 [Labilibaculum filiforme]|uniref:YchJ-like middle NTF2-like domain-containing protein n=1 Tax=Labilibaculum filiforme TaxID=1940526 RepID=A0A2N3HU54_9BACT|nr:YchJ family protein [Labilibaculum filiforme]PKQ61592.1 hypothetical protein BZG02_15510 [Labilibaculum filiforme]
MNKNCFCGNTIAYKECCGAIHSGERKAIKAEDLMRSRYTAFVLADVDYILATYSSETCPSDQKKEILEWTKSVEWIGLEVINVEKGSGEDAIGWVEFKASFIEKGQKQMIHEKSFFRKENDSWVYVSGEYIKPANNKKENLPNRNDSCYCGSGKKFKKCCM